MEFTNKELYSVAGRVIVQLSRFHKLHGLSFPIDSIHEKYLSQNLTNTIFFDKVNKMFELEDIDNSENEYSDKWLVELIDLLDQNQSLLNSYFLELKDELEKAKNQYIKKLRFELSSSINHQNQEYILTKARNLQGLEAIRRVQLFVELILKGKDYEVSGIVDLLRYSRLHGEGV